MLGTVVAARDNTEGVAGVAPEARVIPLRALGADGSGDLADIAEAFDYAGDLGVAVVNASLGGPNESHTLRAAIEGHPRTLFVVAAGNGGDDRAGDDVDVSPEYPCATSSANLLCVAASDNHDNAAGFSNFGRVSVDLFAPGVAIASTSPRSDAQCAMYCLSSGTSMAAPHAAGVAALVVGAHPGLRGAELKAAMLAGVDLHPHFAASVTGGRLNAAGALAAAAGWSTAPEPSSQAPRSTPPPSPVATPSPAPTAPPASPSPPPPAPGPERLDITGARLSAPALRGRRGVGLVVRTSRPATVTVQLSATGSRTAAATLRSATRSGRARFRLQRRLGAVALRSGRYQVRITARSGAATASRALVLRVA